MGEMVGSTGIEETFQEDLRGVPGKRLVERDAEGKELAELARVEPVPGNNIHTSLDLSLQKTAAEAVEKIAKDPKIMAPGAAVVAVLPKTGEVVALYSYPSFDPNAFVGQDKKETPPVEDILTNANNPLFNRVISGRYPPASTFKIITTAAGLEEGALTSATRVEDTGVITIGPFSFSNWYFTQYGGREGDIDIVQALARSNDIFFYKVGEWLGIEKLDKWGKSFHIDKPLGIEIPGEAGGIVRRDREWFLGDTYHAAIGQGDVLATPLQVNSWSQTIANDGVYCRPTLVQHTEGSAPDCAPVGISEETVRLISEGMKNACEPGGTAWPLFNFSVNTASASSSARTFPHDNRNFSALSPGTSISVACKTGTAEMGSENKTHAWLTAYAPVYDPEIVVTVLVEEGGEGSSVAGPVVREILSEWFSKDRSSK